YCDHHAGDHTLRGTKAHRSSPNFFARRVEPVQRQVWSMEVQHSAETVGRDELTAFKKRQIWIDVIRFTELVQNILPLEQRGAGEYDQWDKSRNAHLTFSDFVLVPGSTYHHKPHTALAAVRMMFRDLQDHLCRTGRDAPTPPGPSAL